MTEISTLLHEAAPRPDGPLDMAAIWRRTSRAGRFRRLAWLAGIGAVIAAGVPVADGLLSPATDTSSVRAVRLPAPTPTTVAGPQKVGAALDPTHRPDPGRPSRPGVRAAPQASGSTGPADASSSDACWVTTEGLNENEQRTCRFTALHAGGWNVYQPPTRVDATQWPQSHTPPTGNDLPRARVTVVHRNVTVEYNSHFTYDETTGIYSVEGCQDDIIQPGDEVEVVVTQQPHHWMDFGYATVGVGAGKGWGCANPGP